MQVLDVYISCEVIIWDFIFGVSIGGVWRQHTFACYNTNITLQYFGSTFYDACPRLEHLVVFLIS